MRNKYFRFFSVFRGLVGDPVLCAGNLEFGILNIESITNSLQPTLARHSLGDDGSLKSRFHH